MSKKKRHLVVALAYDGLCTFEFGCAVELFALKRPELGVAWYDFAVCAAERGAIRAAGGIEVRVAHPLALLDKADTIVIPGWRGADELPSPTLVKKFVRPTSAVRVYAPFAPGFSCWRLPVCSAEKR